MHPGRRDSVFLHSVGAELLKFRKRGAVWLVLVLWVVLSLLFSYILPYAKESKGSGTVSSALLPSHLAVTAISGYSFWGGSLVLILGALWIGSEYGWGTFKTLFTVRPPRLTVLAAQLSTLVFALALLVLVSYAASAGTSVAVAAAVHGQSVFPGLSSIIGSMASGWLILCMWGLGGAVLAILTSGTTLSIGLGLVWSLVIETLLRAFTAAVPFVGTLDKYLPGANAEYVISAVQKGSTGAAVGPLEAYATVAIYVAAFALVAGLVISRRDVT